MTRPADAAPHCDKCGAELTSGLMAVFCPHGDACEFFPDDESSRDFIRMLRGDDGSAAQRLIEKATEGKL